MTMTTYEIHKIAEAVADYILSDERFVVPGKANKPRPKRYLNTREAAEILGLSKITIRSIAAQIGGIKGRGEKSHWLFEEAELRQNYLRYKQQIE